MRFLSSIGAVLLLLSVQTASAEEADLSGRVSVNLNAAETVEQSCKLTFLITNRLDGPIERVVYEAVLFDVQGQVDRLTLFDFGALPQTRPRVRQFVVPELTCGALGRVLFNGASTCEGKGIGAQMCETGLAASSRTRIEVLG